MVELIVERINAPSDCNLVFGQSHFIKTTEDLYNALAESAPQIRFGLAFAEASGPRLIRCEGNDKELKEIAGKELFRIGASHAFLIFMRGAFPINALNAIKNVSEVCTVFCATANPVQVILAQTERGRGVLGVIDGEAPLGIEGENEVAQRREMLRKFGYRPQ
ncbi:MAG: adenosine-specific kinase [Candidatus Micrarchaeia archaeon]|jgi:hypothetical protein